MHNWKDNKFLFFVMALVVGLIVGLSIATKLDLSPSVKSEVTNQKNINIQDAIIDVAEDVGKAVVSINTEYVRKAPKIRRYRFGGSPFEESPFDDFFGDFFEDYFGELPDQRQMGVGSGVIIDERGYILTNEHVVSGADKITVTLSDGRKFKGQLQGSDARSDLAIIKIDAKKLPVARLGNSDDVKIGQWVVAIGNPFGFYIHSPEPTVTVGVVSALHRSLPRTSRRDRDYSDLIQTDAAINPGNSGGPLVDLNGQVVGINVAIFSTSGGYQGVGFAIPINIAERIVGKLIEGKKIAYGWLGVNIQDLNEDLADYFDLEETKGIIIAKVLAGSPADEGGLKSGDVLTSFDGKSVNNTRELLKVVGATEAGKKVKIGILRKDKRMTINLKVGERPEDIDEYSPAAGGDSSWRGIEVSDITPEIKQRFRISDDEGVVIVNIDIDSTASESNLSLGDVIDEINTHPIKNTEDFKKITKDLEGKALIRTKRGYFIVKD